MPVFESSASAEMFRSEYAYQADECAARAARAETEDERQALLQLEKTLRQFAETDRRINKVRERNPALFKGEKAAEAEFGPVPDALRR